MAECSENSKNKVGFSSLSQIGVVVRNIEDYLRAIEAVLKVRPNIVVKIPNETMTNLERHYYGESEDFSAMLAFFNFDAIQLEVIQPLTGKSVWKDFLERRGEGIHHIRFGIADMAACDEHFAGLGIKKAQDGYSTKNIEGLKWAYFDTEEKLGFFTEVINDLERLPTHSK